MRFYQEFADWWPLLSPPSHYVEEAKDALAMLDASTPGGHGSLLELGSGGGSLAFHLKARFQMTLSDLSPGMLEVSRAVNPECEHVVGDMRTLRLGRLFDVVLIHDAIMYLTDADSLRAAFRTAAAHCRPGGRLLILPDCVRESFRALVSMGGEDGADGRSLRYLEWSWDPDPADCSFETAYAFMLRSADGSLRVETDRHVEGPFARADWLRWIAEAGFGVRVRLDPWQRDVFIGKREA